jgi:anti-sigma B factor antagonist
MSSSHRLVLEGDMTIYHASALKEQLLGALEQHSGLELDLTGVTEIDTAGCQILILLRREADRLGKSLRLAAAGGAVAEVLTFYGIAAYIGVPPSTAADA